ncbi:hypothetical protein [Streptomyces niveus]|uniref:hypothetical protein n=1 Tax=Streptomyces niveus TaxID=193462 RepID=UPI00157CFCA4|nr:hypothetical protein [Streptomyces niveus]
MGAEPIVAQLARRREAALRCEPLDCGHRDPEDCDDACGIEPDDEQRNEMRNEMPEAPAAPSDAGQWWTDAKARFLDREFPRYGTQAWKDLEPEDPKRLAAALDYAEMWRKYGADIAADLDDAIRARPPISSGVPLAVLDAAARPYEPHELVPTPGWPPIAVPGKPGRYLTYTYTEEGRAAA